MPFHKTYRMVQEKTTKNTVVYSDLDDNISNIYIPKLEFNDVIYPERLTIVIQTEEPFDRER